MAQERPHPTAAQPHPGNFASASGPYAAGSYMPGSASYRADPAAQGFQGQDSGQGFAQYPQNYSLGQASYDSHSQGHPGSGPYPGAGYGNAPQYADAMQYPSHQGQHQAYQHQQLHQGQHQYVPQAGQYQEAPVYQMPSQYAQQQHQYLQDQHQYPQKQHPYPQDPHLFQEQSGQYQGGPMVHPGAMGRGHGHTGAGGAWSPEGPRAYDRAQQQGPGQHSPGPGQLSPSMGPPGPSAAQWGERQYDPRMPPGPGPGQRAQGGHGVPGSGAGHTVGARPTGAGHGMVAEEKGRARGGVERGSVAPGQDVWEPRPKAGAHAHAQGGPHAQGVAHAHAHGGAAHPPVPTVPRSKSNQDNSSSEEGGKPKRRVRFCLDDDTDGGGGGRDSASESKPRSILKGGPGDEGAGANSEGRGGGEGKRQGGASAKGAGRGSEDQGLVRVNSLGGGDGKKVKGPKGAKSEGGKELKGDAKAGHESKPKKPATSRAQDAATPGAEKAGIQRVATRGVTVRAPGSRPARDDQDLDALAARGSDEEGVVMERTSTGSRIGPQVGRGPAGARGGLEEGRGRGSTAVEGLERPASRPKNVQGKASPTPAAGSNAAPSGVSPAGKPVVHRPVPPKGPRPADRGAHPGAKRSSAEGSGGGGGGGGGGSQAPGGGSPGQRQGEGKTLGRSATGGEQGALTGKDLERALARSATGGEQGIMQRRGGIPVGPQSPHWYPHAEGSSPELGQAGSRAQHLRGGSDELGPFPSGVPRGPFLGPGPADDLALGFGAGVAPVGPRLSPQSREQRPGSAASTASAGGGPSTPVVYQGSQGAGTYQVRPGSGRDAKGAPSGAAGVEGAQGTRGARGRGSESWEERQQVMEGTAGGPKAGGQQMPARTGGVGMHDNHNHSHTGASMPVAAVASPRSTIGADWVSNSDSTEETPSSSEGPKDGRATASAESEDKSRRGSSSKGQAQAQVQGQGQGQGQGKGQGQGMPQAHRDEDDEGGEVLDAEAVEHMGHQPAVAGSGRYFGGEEASGAGTGAGAGVQGMPPQGAQQVFQKSGVQPQAAQQLGPSDRDPSPQGAPRPAQEDANGLTPTPQATPPVHQGSVSVYYTGLKGSPGASPAPPPAPSAGGRLGIAEIPPFSLQGGKGGKKKEEVEEREEDDSEEEFTWTSRPAAVFDDSLILGPRTRTRNADAPRTAIFERPKHPEAFSVKARQVDFPAPVPSSASAKLGAPSGRSRKEAKGGLSESRSTKARGGGFEVFERFLRSFRSPSTKAPQKDAKPNGVLQEHPLRAGPRGSRSGAAKGSGTPRSGREPPGGNDVEAGTPGSSRGEGGSGKRSSLGSRGEAKGSSGPGPRGPDRVEFSLSRSKTSGRPDGGQVLTVSEDEDEEGGAEEVPIARSSTVPSRPPLAKGGAGKSRGARPGQSPGGDRAGESAARSSVDEEQEGVSDRTSDARKMSWDAHPEDAGGAPRGSMEGTSRKVVRRVSGADSKKIRGGEELHKGLARTYSVEKGKKIAIEAEVMRLAEEDKSRKSHVVDESSLKGRFSIMSLGKKK